ncbi:Kinase [Hexamita inflata]|uniref:non-specific serine/threonine protein kinase n=1 Tax=Hexamita inflata TaxID=28002 RepID=A0AA86Q380_9EUKA|nr:Kinase [Hexamita inflata]
MQVPSRFQDYLEDLRSSQQQVRMAASIKFRVQCEKETSELLSDPRQALLNDVELFLKYLVQSSNECLQLSAAALIQLFLQQKTHLIQISVLEDLILILCSDKKKSIILAGSQCIQDLSLENRPLDQPWSRVFEFMRTQNLKPNAIILAKNLVKYDSQCSHRINGQFLSELWTFILDQKDPAMSQLGVECFVQILGLKNQGQAFQNLLTSLNSSTNQQVLSALQVMHQLFDQNIQNAQISQIIQDNFSNLLNQLLTKSYKDITIQREIGQTLPYFAQFNTELFVKTFLDQSIEFLVEKHEKLGFLSVIGRLAEIVGQNNIDKHFTKIIHCLLSTFEQPKKKQMDFSTDCLSCINSLARAAPIKLNGYIEALLDAMFVQGLSIELIQALNSLATNLSQWMNQIEERLLQLVGLELAGTNLQLLEDLLCVNFKQAKAINYVQHQPKTLLALETLNQFEFTGLNLSYFCADCVIKYIGSEKTEIRVAASTAILKHMMSSAINYIIVNNVLAQILIIGLTDTEESVREQIICSFNELPVYDDYLAQKDNLDVLFIGVNDASFGVRSSVVSIIGRLSQIHPVIVLPHIREILLSLLFELDYSQVSVTKVENAKLLYTIVQYCNSLIQPFIKSVCRTVLEIKEIDRNEQLIITCLKTLGELFKQSGKDLLEFLNPTIMLILQQMKETSEQLKIEALQTLISVSNGTGLPVVPYYINTELLDQLLTIIKADHSQKVQRFAAKTLVIVGALDYNLIKKIKQVNFNDIIVMSKQNVDTDFEQMRITKQNQSLQHSEIESHGQVQIDQVTGNVIDKNEIIKIENKEVIFQKTQGIDYVSVVLNHIKNILLDSNYDQLFKEAIVSFRRIIQYIKNRPIAFSTNQLIDQIIGELFDIIMNSSQKVMQEHYLRELIYIISSLNPSIRSYLEYIFKLAYKLWDVTDLTPLVFSLIEEVTLKFPGYDFIQQNTQIIQKLLQYYTQQQTTQQEQQTVIRSFNTLVILLPSLKAQIKILLPCLLRLAQNWKNQQLCIATLDCIGRICCTTQLTQIQSSLVQTLLKIMRETHEAVKGQLLNIYQQPGGQGVIQYYKINPVGFKAFETLHYVAIQLGQLFNTYVPIVNKVLVECNYQSTVMNAIITLNLRCQSVRQITLLAFVQSWRDYVMVKTQSKILLEYKQPAVKSLQQVEEHTSDKSTETILDQILQIPSMQTFQQIDPQAPSNIGVEALPECENFQITDSMPKKDWVCDDLEDSEQWRKWLQKLQYSLIKYSPVEVIRYCYDLSQISQRTARELFNYAYYSFSSDVNITSDMRTAVNSTLRNSLLSKSIPKDIVQQMLDLVEFLEHNGENIVSALYEVKLGNISETCYAYARCLRYRESEYQSAPQSTMDILVRINKRLSNHESSKGVIFIELQRLNQTAIALLFEIMIKKCQQFCVDVQKNSVQDFQEHVKNVFGDMLKNELRTIQNGQVKTSKLCAEGTTGGIFVEGRPIFAGIMSKITDCDFSELAKYLMNLLNSEISSKLQTSSLTSQKIVDEMMNQCIRILKDPLTTNFGPKPQWFEALNWYDKALIGYNEQLNTLESRIPQLEGPQLKEALRTQQTLAFQKISCLYHLGCYKQVLEEAEKYIQFIQSLKYDPVRGENMVLKFNVYVAKYCVQSAIELNDTFYDVQTWLGHLDQGMSGQKLLIQSIHYVQEGKLDMANKLVDELIDQIMSPIIAGTLESYERAYDNIITLQQAIELQEVIEFKKQYDSEKYQEVAKMSQYQQNSQTKLYPFDSDSEVKDTDTNKKIQLKSIWTRRLANVFQDLDTWIGILRVKQLVLDKQEAIPIYLSFALKCMKAGRQYLAKNTLEQLLDCSPKNNLQIQLHKHSKIAMITSTNIMESIPEIHSQRYEVIYTYCKYLYQDSNPSNKIAAFVHLTRLADELQKGSQNPELLQRVYMRMSDWYADMVSPIQNEAQMISIGLANIDEISEYRIIEDSAINGVMTGITKHLDSLQGEEDPSTSEYRTDISTMKSSQAQSIPELIGKITVDIVHKQEYKIEQDSFDSCVPGLIDAKYALYWFESAERQNQENIKVERCISHTTGYMVDILDQYEQKISKEDPNALHVRKHKLTYLKKSLNSHFKCMQHKEIQLPSALRLLTLWFQYGTDEQIEDEFIKGLAALDIDVWIEVVPQLIARSTSSNKKIKYLIQQLLIQIGLKHPQLLVFPLMVATKRDQVNQQSEALSILDQIRRAHRNEVDQTILIGSELTRIAITQPEACKDGLFSGIMQYGQDKKALDLLNSMAILIQQFEQDPETPSEQQFRSQYFEQFKQGWEMLKKGVLHNDLQSSEQAKNVFHELYEKLKNDVEKQFIVDMSQVSPILNQLRGSIVQLPGSGGKVFIERFLQRMNVIMSKQRPRKIAIVASDGEVYAYLLKGREDLRQDERVMQLMGLINQLLQGDSFSSRHQLFITRYPCVPIGKNTGLLFWVPRADTVNDLVKNYRIQKNFQENSEDKQLQQRAAHYNQLTLVQKLDAFRFVSQFCPGQDLRQVFWEHSSSSENWLTRRTNFTMSLAVMSMVGYILGLGDRHPANIMINRSSGQTLHIDYGDCFEACQRRSKLPERVPFRLTRILVNAMEVCGVYGLYQKACEVTMRILRNNKDSILAILQTFIYDPLIGWKAVNGSGVIDGIFEEQNQEEVRKNRGDDGVSGMSPLEVVHRIENKLVGRDFEGYDQLNVNQQVQALMQQAQNLENLCQHYYGWCPLW